MKYEIAVLTADGAPSKVRYGWTQSENSAAHIALRTMHKFHQSMCVVEVSRSGERIVQRMTYFPPLIERIPLDARD